MSHTTLLLSGIILILSFSLATTLYKEHRSRGLGGNVVTQIGLVVSDIERSAKAYADLFGMEVPQIIVTDPLEIAHTTYRGNPTEARAKLAFFQLENITIELIEPIGEPSTWKEVLEARGDGMHHIAFSVEGMDEHISLLEGKGGKLVQRGDFTGGSYAYVDSTPEHGLIIELLTSTD